LIAAEGQFGMWELKVTRANAVRISPHQIAFAESHKNYSVWFLVCAATPGGESIYAYHARDVMELARIGLKHTPELQITPPDWLPLLDLINPA
jgi:hypothetical protein